MISAAIVHYADIPKGERSWFGAVPVTSPFRTLDALHASLHLLRPTTRSM